MEDLHLEGSAPNTANSPDIAGPADTMTQNDLLGEGAAGPSAFPPGAAPVSRLVPEVAGQQAAVSTALPRDGENDPKCREDEATPTDQQTQNVESQPQLQVQERPSETFQQHEKDLQAAVTSAGVAAAPRSSGGTYDWAMVTRDIIDSFNFISILEDEMRENPNLLEEMHPKGDIVGLPPESDADRLSGRKTLLLDMDETLSHTSFENLGYEPHLIVTCSEDSSSALVYLRPYVDRFLAAINSCFEVVVFTAASAEYADQILNKIDPTGTLIDHRLYRESCRQIKGSYIKDLSVINRDLSKVILVDNSLISFALQVDNGILVSHFHGSHDDVELLNIVPVLLQVSKEGDVRPHLKHQYKLGDMKDDFKRCKGLAFFDGLDPPLDGHNPQELPPFTPPPAHAPPSRRVSETASASASSSPPKNGGVQAEGGERRVVVKQEEPKPPSRDQWPSVELLGDSQGKERERGGDHARPPNVDIVRPPFDPPYVGLERDAVGNSWAAGGGVAVKQEESGGRGDGSLIGHSSAAGGDGARAGGVNLLMSPETPEGDAVADSAREGTRLKRVTKDKGGSLLRTAKKKEKTTLSKEKEKLTKLKDKAVSSSSSKERDQARHVPVALQARAPRGFAPSSFTSREAGEEKQKLGAAEQKLDLKDKSADAIATQEKISRAVRQKTEGSTTKSGGQAVQMVVAHAASSAPRRSRLIDQAAADLKEREKEKRLQQPPASVPPLPAAKGDEKPQRARQQQQPGGAGPGRAWGDSPVPGPTSDPALPPFSSLANAAAAPGLPPSAVSDGSTAVIRYTQAADGRGGFVMNGMPTTTGGAPSGTDQLSAQDTAYSHTRLRLPGGAHNVPPLSASNSHSHLLAPAGGPFPGAFSACSSASGSRVGFTLQHPGGSGVPAPLQHHHHGGVLPTEAAWVHSRLHSGIPGGPGEEGARSQQGLLEFVDGARRGVSGGGGEGRGDAATKEGDGTGKAKSPHKTFAAATAAAAARASKQKKSGGGTVGSAVSKISPPVVVAAARPPKGSSPSSAAAAGGAASSVSPLRKGGGRTAAGRVADPQGPSRISRPRDKDRAGGSTAQNERCERDKANRDRERERGDAAATSGAAGEQQAPAAAAAAPGGGINGLPVGPVSQIPAGHAPMGFPWHAGAPPLRTTAGAHFLPTGWPHGYLVPPAGAVLTRGPVPFAHSRSERTFGGPGIPSRHTSSGGPLHQLPPAGDASVTVHGAPAPAAAAAAATTAAPDAPGKSSSGGIRKAKKEKDGLEKATKDKSLTKPHKKDKEKKDKEKASVSAAAGGQPGAKLRSKQKVSSKTAATAEAGQGDANAPANVQSPDATPGTAQHAPHIPPVHRYMVPAPVSPLIPSVQHPQQVGFQQLSRPSSPHPGFRIPNPAQRFVWRVDADGRRQLVPANPPEAHAQPGVPGQHTASPPPAPGRYVSRLSPVPSHPHPNLVVAHPFPPVSPHAAAARVSPIPMYQQAPPMQTNASPAAHQRAQPPVIYAPSPPGVISPVPHAGAPRHTVYMRRDASPAAHGHVMMPVAAFSPGRTLVASPYPHPAAAVVAAPPQQAPHQPQPQRAQGEELRQPAPVPAAPLGTVQHPAAGHMSAGGLHHAAPPQHQQASAQALWTSPRQSDGTVVNAQAGAPQIQHCFSGPPAISPVFRPGFSRLNHQGQPAAVMPPQGASPLRVSPSNSFHIHMRQQPQGASPLISPQAARVAPFPGAGTQPHPFGGGVHQLQHQQTAALPVNTRAAAAPAAQAGDGRGGLNESGGDGTGGGCGVTQCCAP
uniref:FCP1 homology domain-containing protein n=1 Tax=Chromera velia CCMP2878 TaxID=1169474 RepID=A0A0G4GEP2_9ALVE|eukprot:Cvel_4608.t1-p1 / transcript=Cvel_4608.t1 / gene=Cvel_4608 / organism=Chromera_velia_CCMP2878 / gene_product=CTD small phosphatase-like protein 2, putative / transcript_product=CTD small phosphatase-like protein 2, putative / location=Cvel_scaffold202:87501-96288(-) / protein_length=1778 / sequence_SO=supercontig / SO=protein_coding / is_pseudo=false